MFGSTSPSTFTVSAITEEIRERLESAFEDVTVEGELSNFRRYGSGHVYFTLKDADAQLSGVMWRGYARYLPFEPEDGQHVRVHGSISVYAARGIYQVVARSMQPAGEGALRQAFEALKARLEAEGLFDPDRKQALPTLPKRIGLITSGDGAALRDMLSVLSRRYPLVEVFVFPVRVQGAFAADEISAALNAFNTPSEEVPSPDLLIVGRGGGSIEDLWAFNEEPVVRAIAASSIPIVSAVGHETDFTLADFAADLRAATPTEAAELAVPDARELALHLAGVGALLANRVQAMVDERRQRIRFLRHAHAFNRPVDRLRVTTERMQTLAGRLDRAGARLVDPRRRAVEAVRQRLAALHPEAPLRRGYAFVTREGRPVTSAGSLADGSRVHLEFADGRRGATILPEDDTSPGSP